MPEPVRAGPVSVRIELRVRCGAAVAANLAAAAIGTETDGSIVCPSSVCGVGSAVLNEG